MGSSLKWLCNKKRDATCKHSLNWLWLQPVVTHSQFRHFCETMNKFNSINFYYHLSWLPGLENEGWFDPWTLLNAFKRKAISMGVIQCYGEVTGLLSRPLQTKTNMLPTCVVFQHKNTNNAVRPVWHNVLYFNYC